MHDNALTHRARIVQDLLVELGTEVMEWPPYSPDLSPTENLWVLMKTKIHELDPDMKHVLTQMKVAKEACNV